LFKDRRISTIADSALFWKVKENYEQMNDVVDLISLLDDITDKWYWYGSM